MLLFCHLITSLRIYVYISHIFGSDYICPSSNLGSANIYQDFSKKSKSK